MTERPILFNEWSVRAVLNGRKTQTRRVVKPQPQVSEEFSTWTGRKKWGDAVVKFTEHNYASLYSFEESIAKHCPYGVPSDRLWVRETWLTDHQFDDLKPSEIPRHLATLWYQADNAPIPPCMGKTRPSIHMCRWMSRITLEVTDVRVERIQDITRSDILAEGLDIAHLSGGEFLHRWIDLWDSINADRGYGWDVNPWVWAVTFKVLE